MVTLRNRAEVYFGDLSQGSFFLFDDGIYLVVEKFNDDEWTNAVCLKGSHESGHRNNFEHNTLVIPLSHLYIDYEI